ncbi:MAG: M48 family metallopeptidase [Oscillospiraceae bacterium]|nr:M48 family metallopeptidase [Oscillospiraceae bacterium]
MTFTPYTLIRSARKTLSIQITPAGEVLLRCPNRMPKREAEAFLNSKQSWVEKHLSRCRPLPPLTEPELQWLTDAAKEDLIPRVCRLAAQIGVSYGRVTIRSQHTRWGSCSAKGNLNFNCLLMLCPEEIRDYVVIHELCHRKELNHSPAFWTEVERSCPMYRTHRQWLKEHGAELIGRLPA